MRACAVTPSGVPFGFWATMDRMHVRKKMAPAGNECYYAFLLDGFYI